MKKLITIYLAGAMQNCESLAEMNTWRLQVKNVLENAASFKDNVELNVINPVDYYNFENPRHQNDFEVMKYDIAKVKSSDIVVVNLNGLNTSIGTSIELYESYKNDIPVIALDLNNEYDSIHSWLKCCITRVERSNISLAAYIDDFYFL